MELFCGTDILEISRMEKSLRNPRFVQRVFGPRELGQYGDKLPPASLAAAFCAKEAFSKALGTGIRAFRLSEVELLHEESGKPWLFFSGRAAQIVKERGLRFEVSLSHTRELAIAHVVAWREN